MSRNFPFKALSAGRESTPRSCSPRGCEARLSERKTHNPRTSVPLSALLVDYGEAPTLLAYSSRNRSASIRIPYEANSKGRRIELRFPDSMANPYLAFAAMMMAGLDGIQNRIHPGEPMDKDLYDLPPEEEKELDHVAFSLEEALIALDKDRTFLKNGGVFTDDLIDAYIDLKMQNVTRLRMAPHPVEFDMYYSL